MSCKYYLLKKNPSKDDLKKILRVRRFVIQKCLYWLKMNTILYQDVIINDKKLYELPEDDIPENIFNEISYNDENCEDSEEKDLCINGYDRIDRNNIDIIETNDLQSSGLMNVLDATGLSESDKIEMIQFKKINNNILTIPHGKTPINEWFNSKHLLNAFSTLFPFGTDGIMDENRNIKLSYRQHLIYLLNLNCNRFRIHVM
jgi:hypothetical protein